MSTYLVTGGAGFIGSNIVSRLVTDGHSVRVLDNLATGRRKNLAAVEDDIDFVEGDIRDADTVKNVMDGVDYVLHQAALPSVQRSIDDPVASNDVNVLGTLGLLEAARKAGVKRFVMASSSSVYGDTPMLPKREDMPPNPKSFYAVSKYAAEQQTLIYNTIHGLPTVCLRYFNVYGPRQDPKAEYAAVIPTFITAMLAGEQPIVYGDGSQSRDFTYIDDVVEANLCAATAKEGAGRTYNIAFGGQHTLNDLVSALNDILGTDITPRFDAPRAGDVKHSYADTALAKKYIDYSPRFDFHAGLEQTVEWFRTHG